MCFLKLLVFIWLVLCFINLFGELHFANVNNLLLSIGTGIPEKIASFKWIGLQITNINDFYFWKLKLWWFISDKIMWIWNLNSYFLQRDV